MHDLNIIELYFARDERAIKETDAKYGKLCFKIAYNILHNHEDCEECVNDTYLGVWNAIPPTRPDNFMAFICKIARNTALKKLESDGYIQKATDADDSRRNRIELTEKGRGVMTQTCALFSSIDRTMTEGFDDAELDALLAALEKIEKNLQRFLQNPQ